ncbi:excisionase family DNA-binding protein [Salegentibacter sp. JZCK2]|uniref:excisionase family DNA-binding protein n=1 Tax=Salegentibacter tibetensis TaxID=2873600 RepID=UPI001CCD55A0|nr:excisionase family DNA-binding protein [Salegentibacter tibetensis]
MLGCSRPHLVKPLEDGEIAFNKVGKHRRVLLENVTAYKAKMKKDQKKHLIDIMKSDEELELYDS